MWTGAALLVSPDETSQCRVLLFYRYFPVTSRVVCKGLNGHAITASQLTLVQIARVSTGQLHEKVEFGINGFRFYPSHVRGNTLFCQIAWIFSSYRNIFTMVGLNIGLAYLPLIWRKGFLPGLLSLTSFSVISLVERRREGERCSKISSSRKQGPVWSLENLAK